MKIVYCIAKTHNSGGMERVLANKANYLVKQGYEVIIVTTDQCGKEPFFPLDSQIQCYDLAINYEENNGKTFLNKVIHYPFKQRKHKRKLSALLGKLKADIVISMCCNDASFIMGINDGSKKILEIHFSKFKRLQYDRKGIWKLADSYRSRLDEKMVRKFDRFVVLTEEDQKYWGNLPNVEIIPNMLSFQPSRVSDLENKKVIAIGRYTYQKGFENLVNAWKTVHGQQPDWRLEIIGNGELEGRLKEQIVKGKLDGYVFLKSPIRQVDIIYEQASMLVMSSRYEGFGMVLVEAESFGIPVISFACKCGPKDIITDGMDGFLVPEGDINILADRILQLMKDKDLRQRMGIAAKKNSERFSPSVIMEKWMTLFNNLMNEKR